MESVKNSQKYGFLLAESGINAGRWGLGRKAGSLGLDVSLEVMSVGHTSGTVEWQQLLEVGIEGRVPS